MDIKLLQRNIFGYTIRVDIQVQLRPRTNKYIIALILQQIFMFYKKVKLEAG